MLKESQLEMIFLLEEATPGIANALRRTMLADVPTMAIDYVIIFENTSLLFDEQLAHILGQIPLTTDLEKYNLPEECSCNGAGCPLCTTTLTLEVKAEDEPITVYSRNLKPQDPDIKPVYPDIPIIKLNKGQRITLQAVAKLGTGAKHAKWQPLTTIGYKYYPTLQLSAECDLCGDCVERCPRGALRIEGNKLVLDPISCNICKLCVEECKKEALKVAGDPTRFIFKLKSSGSLSCREIVKEAINIIIKKVTHVEENLSS